MSRIPVMIDCDTGIDDAIALVIACASDRLDIRAVTTVAGNVGLEHTTRNTLNVLDLLGRRDIPVASGADRPLARELLKASLVHGFNGLRGYRFERDADSWLAGVPAWELMRQTLEESPEPLTLIVLGPLTNVAILLERYPHVQSRISRIVFMGTSWHDGNPTPLATFNVLVDPEAFRKVLFSGIEFYACPLDTTRTAYITTEEQARIQAIGGPAAALVDGILSGYSQADSSEIEIVKAAGKGEEPPKSESMKQRSAGKKRLHDPATVAFVVRPELFTYTKYYCDVECSGELTTGFTLVDKADYYGKSEAERNLHFIESVQRESLVELLMDSIRHFAP